VKPKVLFLYKKSKLPSSRIRVLNLLPELLKHEIDASALPWPRSPVKKIGLLFRLSNYDIIVLQKKLLPLVDFMLLRKFAKRLVFDFDDAIFILNDRAKDSFSRVRLSRFARTAKSVDMVIAGNPILADEAIRYTKRVTTLPSAVETAGIPIKKWDNEAKNHVIGWVGIGKNLHHLSMIGEVLRRLATEYPIELRVVSNQCLHIKGVKVTNIPWTLAGQAAEIADFDIGVMPLPKNRWTEGKCSYKMLQYMAAGVPVVASNWGYNRHVIKDGETGLLADDNDEFYSKIRMLIESPSLAKQVGLAGRALIDLEFSVEVVGAKLGMLLQRCSKE